MADCARDGHVRGLCGAKKVGGVKGKAKRGGEMSLRDCWLVEGELSQGSGRLELCGRLSCCRRKLLLKRR